MARAYQDWSTNALREKRDELANILASGITQTSHNGRSVQYDLQMVRKQQNEICDELDKREGNKTQKRIRIRNVGHPCG